MNVNLRDNLQPRTEEPPGTREESPMLASFLTRRPNAWQKGLEGEEVFWLTVFWSTGFQSSMAGKAWPLKHFHSGGSVFGGGNNLQRTSPRGLCLLARHPLSKGSHLLKQHPQWGPCLQTHEPPLVGTFHIWTLTSLFSTSDAPVLGQAAGRTTEVCTQDSEWVALELRGKGVDN